MDEASDNGVMYVATKQPRYLEEAFLSACSIKERFPRLSITLFTDDGDNILCSTSVFDRVVVISGNAGIRQPWAEGQLNLLRCLRRTPYERTLHLDTDTRVLTDELPGLFSTLAKADLAMAETGIDESYSRKRLGKRLFNAGVILYRRNERVWEWLRRWEELSERNFRLANKVPLPAIPLLDHIQDELVRRRLLCNDQTSLLELVSPEYNFCQLKMCTLDYSWNHRGSRLAENNLYPPRILHNRPQLPRHQELLKAALEKWASLPKGNGH